MKKQIALILSCFMLLSVFAGCEKQVTIAQEVVPGTSETSIVSAQATESVVSQPQEETDETVIFTDSCGREVELPKNLTRVAPSGSVAQMILYSVNPDCMIGWSKNPGEKVLEYFPKNFAELPEFGQFYGKNVSLNLEALIKTNPQVIIDLGDKKPTHKEDMDAIQEQTGIPTIFIEANLETFPTAYRTLGKLLNSQEQAEKIAVYLEETIAQAGEIASTIPAEERKSIMFGTGESGLNCNAKGSIHADVIDLIGADNAIVVGEISNKGGGNTINMEEVIHADPNIIILANGGPFAQVGTDPLWQGLSAVKNKTYYEIPKGPYDWMGSPPSVNRIIGIKWLGNLVYPEQFDLDMVKEAQTFYDLFWHYDLSEEDALALLQNSTVLMQNNAKA